MHYPKFVRTFEANVEDTVQEPNRRFLLLTQYCEGEAKRMIEYWLLLDSNVGYKRAKETLERNSAEKMSSQGLISKGFKRERRSSFMTPTALCN